MQSPIINDSNNKQKLIDDLKLKENSIIAIGGDTRIGKTNLSYFIGYHLIRSVLNLDDFIAIPNQGSFVNVLDFERLKQRINIFKNPIIEGVCILKVLEKLEITDYILIYCEEISESAKMGIRI